MTGYETLKVCVLYLYMLVLAYRLYIGLSDAFLFSSYATKVRIRFLRKEGLIAPYQYRVSHYVASLLISSVHAILMSLIWPLHASERYRLYWFRTTPRKMARALFR